MKLPKRLQYKQYPNSQLGLPGYVVEQFPIAAPKSWDENAVDRIKFVVFEQFDTEAAMKIEVTIHWTNAIQYMLTKWPKHGSITKVITESGRTVWAKALSAAFDHNYPDTARGWNNSPDLLRKTVRIVDLQGCYPLLQIVGHDTWMYDRDLEKFNETQKLAAKDYQSGIIS